MLPNRLIILIQPIKNGTIAFILIASPSLINLYWHLILELLLLLPNDLLLPLLFCLLFLSQSLDFRFLTSREFILLGYKFFERLLFDCIFHRRAIMSHLKFMLFLHLLVFLLLKIDNLLLQIFLPNHRFLYIPFKTRIYFFYIDLLFHCWLFYFTTFME